MVVDVVEKEVKNEDCEILIIDRETGEIFDIYPDEESALEDLLFLSSWSRKKYRLVKRSQSSPFF